jgi:hypothetical protein
MSSLPLVMIATVLSIVVNRLYCKPGYMHTHLTRLNATIAVLYCSCYGLGLDSTPQTRNMKIGAPLELLGPAVC